MAYSGIVGSGGLAAMVGGALWILWSLLGRASMAAGGSLSDVLLLLAALLTLVGGGPAEIFLQGLVAPVGSLTVLVGLVLYGAAALQAMVLPAWCGLALIVVPPVSFYMNSRVFYGSIALFGVLWVALGYVLWARRDTPTEQRPSRVR